MGEPIVLEDFKERVILVGVSEQDGDDAEDSLAELASCVPLNCVPSNVASMPPLFFSFVAVWSSTCRAVCAKLAMLTAHAAHKVMNIRLIFIDLSFFLLIRVTLPII